MAFSMACEYYYADVAELVSEKTEKIRELYVTFA